MCKKVATYRTKGIQYDEYGRVTGPIELSVVVCQVRLRCIQSKTTALHHNRTRHVIKKIQRSWCDQNILGTVKRNSPVLDANLLPIECIRTYVSPVNGSDGWGAQF